MDTVLCGRIQALYYVEGRSVTQVAKELCCSPHKVIYWMDKMKLARRNMSDAIYRYYNPDGDPFFIQPIKTQDEARLFGLGIGIYWGEGDKRSKHSVRIANTDPGIILTFIQFLLVCCTVKKEKIRYSIVCFNDSSIEAVGEHWAKLLQIPKEKFGKIVQIPPQGRGSYKRKSEFGVCTVGVSNIKLKQWIIQELDSYRSLGSLVVKHSHGKGRTVGPIPTPGSSSEHEE